MSAYVAGELLAWLADNIAAVGEPERDAVRRLVVGMHDAGEIDAVEALFGPGVKWDWTPEWLARQQVIRTLLPQITTAVAHMMTVIDAVCSPIVQHVFDEAFLAWCEADPSRADEVIALMDGGTHVSDRFVLAALVAGLRTKPERYLELSACMARGEHPGGRHLGVRALGVMPASDDVSVGRAVETLGAVIKDCGLDGTLRANALCAAIDIAVRAPSAAQSQFVELLLLASDDADRSLLDACAGAFARHAPRLSPSLLGCMRDVLSKLDVARTQAINEVDMGLYQLLSAPNGNDWALAIIEALVRREDGASIFERLDSTGHELSNTDNSRLSAVVVRWLMSGEPALCNAASKLIGGVHGHESTLTVDPGRLSLTDAQASFIARKAIGWLFIKPTAPTSLVISLLRQVTDEGAATIADLLYDPLLMNYPGSVRRLIEAALPRFTGAVRDAVDRTLARHDTYLYAIKTVGRVPELHQSERNRRIEAQREDDGFKAARRAAEGQSLLRLIARRSLLLYGTRAISYVEDFGSGGNRRLDNKLGHMSVEMERPVQWTFDPLGLENTLLAFRLERTPA